MSSFDAGRILATADLDREPFQRALRLVRAEGAKLDKERYAPSVGADTKDGDRKVNEFRTKLDRLSTQRVTPKLSVDNAAGLVKLVDFSDRLDKISRDITNARVEVQDDRAREKLDLLAIKLREVGAITSRPRVSVEGVERANLQLDRLALKLAAVNRAGPGRAGAGGSGGGLFSRLAGAGSGGFFGGFGPLAVGGLSAALPVGGVLAGGAASFLTPAVAGTAGLGLFGAASAAALKRVSTEQQQINKLNARIARTPATNPAGSPARIAAAQARLTAAQAALQRAQYVGGNARISGAQASVASAQAGLQTAQGGGANKTYENLVRQRNDLLKKMTPAERDAAKGLEGLEKQWVRFQRALEPQTFGATAAATHILTRGLNDLLPMTKAVGDEVVILEQKAGRALKDPFWQHFFGDFLTREAPRAVDSLGLTIGHVVDGIAHLSERWAPLGHDLESGLVRIGKRFDAWTQGEGPGKFLAFLDREGPVVGDAALAIGRGLSGIAKGFAPIGNVELKALTPVLNFIGKLGDEHPEVITALGAAYLGVAGGLKAIAAVKGITGVASILTGGRIGGRGGGGKLGGFSGSLSAPVPVYVTNWEGGGGGFGPGGGPREKAPTAGEVGKAGIAGRLGLQGVTRLAGPLALAYAATAGGDVNPGVQDRPYTLAGITNPRSVALFRKLIAGLPSTGQYATGGGIDSPNKRIDIPAVVQATLNSGTPQQMAILDSLASTSKSVADIVSGLTYQRRFGNLNPDVTGGGRGLGGNLNPNVQAGGQVTNIFNLPNASFTNVNDPAELKRKLQAEQRLKALSRGSGTQKFGI